MSKRRPITYNLSDFKAKKAKEGAIHIELEGGETVTVPPAVLWPDEAHGFILERDIVNAGIAILGEPEYQRFAAAGGSASLLNAILADAADPNAED
jgi:hypothetical protein